MSAPEVTSTLFLCDGAAMPVKMALPDNVRIEELSTVADDGNTNLQLDSLVTRLGSRLPALAEDLVFIASYSVAADQLIRRGSKSIDVHRSRWRRRMLLSVPVSDPERWNSDPVKHALEQALAFATEDSWSFTFTQRPPRSLLQLRINELDDRQIMGRPDCVVLFSGGTDSLCALVEALGKTRLHPVAVSHRTANQIHRWQLDLMDGVQAAFPDWPIPHLSFTMHRRGTGDSDPAQRTRPFLFAALGTAIAATLGIDRVFLPDNGYVSVNPRISGELAGALASRGTHPTLLRLLSRLNAHLFATPIAIENPLAHRTRAEALAVLREQGCRDLLAYTHSCGNHRARPRQQPHCGYCSQCVDRRFGTLAAGLATYDPAERYGVDIFTAPLPDGEGRKIPAFFVQFARDTEAMDDDAVLVQHPEILGCIDPEHPLSLTQVIGVLRRHAREVMSVMRQQFVVQSEALAYGRLPTTCLLRLDGDPNVRPNGLQPEAPDTQLAGGAEEYLIEQTRHVCRFTFRGDKGEVKSSRGVKQLVRLLTSPHQDLPAVDLAYDMQPPSRSPRATLIEEGLREPDDSEELIDAMAQKEYRKRAREIENLLTADMPEADRTKMRQELEFIEEELRRTTGLGGRRRQSGRQEKARTLVRKNVRLVLDALEDVLPPLHDHLRQSLHFGYVCSYRPNPPVFWQIAQ